MTQRTKNIILIIGFVLLLIVSYLFAISETLDTRSQVIELEKEATNFSQLNSRSLSLKRQEKFLDSILVVNKIKNTSVQNNLLDLLNEESAKNGFSISSFNEPHVFKDDLSSITSYSFSLQGDFNDLSAVIYQLEQEYNLGRIVHVNFEKKRYYRRNKDYLECFVVLEGLDL